MLALTTEAALNILTEWLQDNISCGTVLIFDNDEDRTDSATLLPWIEQARKMSAHCTSYGHCWFLEQAMSVKQRKHQHSWWAFLAVRLLHQQQV